MLIFIKFIKNQTHTVSQLSKRGFALIKHKLCLSWYLASPLKLRISIMRGRGSSFSQPRQIRTEIYGLVITHFSSWLQIRWWFRSSQIMKEKFLIGWSPWNVQEVVHIVSAFVIFYFFSGRRLVFTQRLCLLQQIAREKLLKQLKKTPSDFLDSAIFHDYRVSQNQFELCR